ncbi:MAG: PAS domain S-box protein [Desulfobacteraceae bacterium]|nr:MAG: PAS domain S-box protein [Desulfobacteraceae bacterium]
MDPLLSTKKEISCRVTRTLLAYVREMKGSLQGLLDGLELDEAYLMDTNNWVSHAFLHVLYARMIELVGDENAVYKMNLAGTRLHPLGLLDWMVRLLGNPRLIYLQAPRYNKLLKANGDVFIHEAGESWVLLEDRYHDSGQKRRLDCDYTRGVLAAIPTLFDMPPAEVEEIECQVVEKTYGDRVWPDHPAYGAKGCLYRIRWNSRERPPFWKRIFQQYSVYRIAIRHLQEANRLIQEKYDEARRLATELESANRELTASKQQLENYMAELKTSERRYRLLAENVTDNIWTMSLDPLRFTYISPSVEKMRGYTVEEALATTLEDLLAPETLDLVSNRLAEELAREASGSFDPDRSATLEMQQRCKDGSFMWVEGTMTFLRDENGKAVGILGVSRDISERKRAEQLYQAKIAAEAASAEKSKFLSNMSHELRTPLNHILGFSELLLGKSFGELNPKQEEYLSDVHESGLHLLSLVNEILDVSKIEAGKLELKPAEIDLKHLLEQSLTIIMDKTKSRNIDLKSCLEDLPDTISADQLRLKQILYNLLSNAAKFTPDGGTIRLNARMRSAKGEEGIERNEVEIGVTDSGIGIRKEDLAKIFEPFSQLENSLSRKYPGTGLGLALTRNLVEMHAGRIWVESEGPGKGSTFRFTLPV